MAGVGPPDRRIPDRPRAGPRRHGDRLRGRPRRARPAGGAEGPRHARRARLLGAPAVPQRGQDRRRAAPHAHRARLRRRPGRRPLLLRHAADRGERARPGDPPPPPQPAGRRRAGRDLHVQRRRRRRGHVVVRLAVRPDLAAGLAGMALAAAPARPARCPRREPDAGRPDRTEGARAGLGLLPPMPTGDSTASWGSRRIERRDGTSRASPRTPIIPPTRPAR